MNERLPALRFPAGFSLVETVVAIGIFAFVIVGIVALFPTGLKQQAQSANESLGVLVAQQIMASIAAAGSLTDVNVAIGDNTNRPVNLLASPLVLGFRGGNSLPVFCFDNDGPAALAWHDPPSSADFQSMMSEGIVAVAKAEVSEIRPGLYRINIDVGSPATVPLDKRQIDSFASKISMP
jgi:type II secretory pathway pseudopilin PulG